MRHARLGQDRSLALEIKATQGLYEVVIHRQGYLQKATPRSRYKLKVLLWTRLLLSLIYYSLKLEENIFSCVILNSLKDI